MYNEDIAHHFESLGEIWRDLTALEFLMRFGIAKKDGQEFDFPQPPYIKGKSYAVYPDAFKSSYGFEVIVNKWNSRFPTIHIPNEVAELRHAMAHGLMASWNGDDTEQLLKLKEKEDTDGVLKLFVENNISLERARLDQIRQSLKEMRQLIVRELNKI